MAVPRPVLLLLVLGAALLAATFYTVRGAREHAQTEAISEAVQPGQPQPASPAKPTAKAKPGPDGAKKQNATGQPEAPPAPAKPNSKPAKPAPQPGRAPVRKDPGKSLGLPADVARAIGKRRTVVVLFYRRGVADDDATAKAVDSVRGRKVSVFKASPAQFGSYRRLVGGLELSSLPAVVIVGRDRSAHVVEGFVDSKTLAQEVADSSR